MRAFINRVICRIFGHHRLYRNNPATFRPARICARCLRFISDLDGRPYEYKDLPTRGAIAYKAASGPQIDRVRAYFKAEGIRPKREHRDTESPDVVAVIRSEEVKYFKLLRRMEADVRCGRIAADVDDRELARLWDEKGYDAESVCGLIGQPFSTDRNDRIRGLVAARQAGKASQPTEADK